MTFLDFCQRARTYCEVTGASVMSWGRTWKHNRDLKGVAHSPHLAWLAVDVIYDVAFAVEERRAWAERMGLTLVVEDDHDHLQPAGWMPGQMLHLYRVEYERVEELFSTTPIVTRLFVRAERRDDVPRLAAEAFTQVYGQAPEKLHFDLKNVWSAE